ncbi:MAG: class I tRNA ligase family protein, partial [Chloroflexi bacterium]|nr:class I tRNA ligase family protein [Chloroflexota bacterium]
FANKIWNATRFVVHNLSKATKADAANAPAHTDADKWILTRLSEVINDCDRLMDNYQFGEAGRQVYDFLWSDFADWYVELSKVQLQESSARAWTTLSVLRTVIDHCLRLLHPFIPFVTEETWQQLKQAFIEADLGIAPAEGWAEALIIADWPQAGVADADAAANFELLRELVRSVRAARNDNNVAPGKRITATLSTGSKVDFFTAQRAVLVFLARFDEEGLVIAETAVAPDNALTISLGDVSCYLPLAGMVDLDKEKERLQKEIAALEKEIKRL